MIYFRSLILTVIFLFLVVAFCFSSEQKIPLVTSHTPVIQSVSTIVQAQQKTDLDFEKSRNEVLIYPIVGLALIAFSKIIKQFLLLFKSLFLFNVFEIMNKASLVKNRREK